MKNNISAKKIFILAVFATLLILPNVYATEVNELSDLQSVFTDAIIDGNKVTLNKTYELGDNSVIIKSGTYEIDLNGYNIISTDISAIEVRGGNLTISNSTSSLGLISANQNEEFASSVYIEGGNLTINNGKIGNSALASDCGLYIHDGAVIINNGEFAGQRYGLCMNAGTLTIHNGIFKSTTTTEPNEAIGIYGGTVIINDGEFTSTTSRTDGWGIYAENWTGNTSVTVNGGTFTGKIIGAEFYKETDHDFSIIVNGGNFIGAYIGLRLASDILSDIKISAGNFESNSDTISERIGAIVIQYEEAEPSTTPSIWPILEDGRSIYPFDNSFGSFTVKGEEYFALTTENSVEVKEGVLRAITISDFDNGTVTSNKQSAILGEEITLTIQPANSYRLKRMEVKDSSDNYVPVTNNKFIMPDADVDIIAEFELTKSITMRDMINGIIISDKDVAIPGETVTLTVSPNSGYKLNDIRISDMYDDEPVSLNNNYSFTMPEYNVFVYAEFSIIPTSSGSSTPKYKITVVQNENGEISFDGSSRVKRNKDKEFIITANEGYEIEDVLVDGESVGRVSTYTFENVKKAHTIEARYKETEIQYIPYTDVFENDWFSDGIEYVTVKGLMSGIENNKFNPSRKATRAMIITTLYNVEGEPEVNYETSFKDVEKGESYEKPIAWAERNSIVKGFKEGIFAPDNEVTREELAVIMLNYIDYKNIEKPKDISELNFADNDEISSWAKDAVKLIKEMKIMQGKSNNLFDPLGFTTRAEIATVMMNFSLELVYNRVPEDLTEAHQELEQ